MAQISGLFKANMDIIFFLYGLAFVVMGIAILVQPKKGRTFKIAGIMWLLAAFGVTHGANEWLDMWAIIRGKNVYLDYVRWMCLVSSYVFLFDFGLRLVLMCAGGDILKEADEERPTRKTAARLITAAVAFVVICAGLASSDFWRFGSLWARYLLGLPGGLLTAAGFFMYYDGRRELLDGLHMKKYFTGASAAFCVYGVLGGFIVPKADFFPAKVFNVETFMEFTGMPVQAFRAALAIAAGWAVTGILYIFNWESENALHAALNRSRESAAKLRSVVNNVGMGIATIGRDMIVLSANSRLKQWFPGIDLDDAPMCYESFGYSPRRSLCPSCPVIRTFEDGGVHEAEAGTLTGGNGTIHFRVVSSPIMDEEGRVASVIEMIEDITERVEIEEKLLEYRDRLEDMVLERSEKILKVNRRLEEEISVRKEAQERISRHVETLRGNIDAVIKAIASAVEAKDSSTAGHQRRVAELVQRIAGVMGLADDAVAGTVMAASIHDLGRIYVPAEILSRPCRLNEIEFSFIKTHSQVGYDILKHIEFPWPVADIVLQHHEKLDGSDYPLGLKGEGIHLGARIVCVADVVEAMCSHRPYREALGVDAAMEELRGGSGTLYDPGVVDACIEALTGGGFEFK
jgi:HD-GYP domain-containing protein (c-di-GMP phosphodiesterase class II)